MSLAIIEEELLAEKVKENPALSDKTVKDFKEKDAVINVWEIKIFNITK